MIRISAAQMSSLEREYLSRLKAKIIKALGEEFPAVVGRLEQSKIATLVQQTLQACRTVWIDEDEQLFRASRIAFVLEFVRPNNELQRHFARILASEEAPEARLKFAETALLGN